MLDYLLNRDPFTPDPGLQSISSGVVANDKVNVDSANEVRKAIVAHTEGKQAATNVFKKSKQAIVKCDDVGANRKIRSLFSHELCAFPPSLFESSSLLREVNKADRIAQESRKQAN